MLKYTRILLLLILVSFSQYSSAQNTVTDYSAVDKYVQTLGSFDTLNMGTIAELVTKNFTDKKEKARAIFDWIVYHISYDCKAARTANTQKNSSTEVLQYRKAVGIGFASLFQDMCSSANIRCLIPDGFVKNSPEQINDTKTDINHSWAVVQLGQSPDEWYYVDPALGSGNTDEEMKVFTRAFNDAYFFANKAIFNLQHYPDNEAWKLGPAPKTKKDFYDLPIIRYAAYSYKLVKFSPASGHITTAAGKPQTIILNLDAGAVIAKVSLLKGDRKKQKEEVVTYSFDKGMLKITCKFEQTGNYPATILLNGQQLITYIVDVD